MPVLRADLEMQITICRFALRTDGAQLRSRGDSITKDKAALVPGPKYIDNVELAACDRQRHQAIDLVDRADGPGQPGDTVTYSTPQGPNQVQLLAVKLPS